MSAPEPAPTVTVAVVNYNGARFLPDLLDSLQKQSFQDRELLLIDNGSGDDSLEIARRCAGLRILPQQANLGFSRAANLAACKARGRYLALLNADIVLEPGWLEELVAAADADPEAAAVACKMMLFDRPGVLNGVGGCMNRLGYSWDRGYGQPDDGRFDEPAEVLFASAGAALFRRRILIDAGGFDERFFMYHEDVDLGWRLWLLGHRVVTAPAARALHHFGGTTRREKSLSWRERLGERNNIRALIKNYEAATLREALVRLLCLRQNPTRKLTQLGNFACNLGWLPDTVRQRRRIQTRRRRSDRQMRRLIVQSTDVPVRL